MELTGKNYTRNDWRKLLATRRGTVLVAAACALIAGGILLVAMNSYRSSVDSSGNHFPRGRRQLAFVHRGGHSGE
jgi:hypothetical protein